MVHRSQAETILTGGGQFQYVYAGLLPVDGLVRVQAAYLELNRFAAVDFVRWLHHVEHIVTVSHPCLPCRQ